MSGATSSPVNGAPQAAPAQADRHRNGKARLLRLFALTAVALTSLYVSMVQTSGNDFWLQAKIGELVWTGHAIPGTLLFPFTEVADQPFHAHEWMASLLFHGLLSVLGEEGLPYVTALLGLAFTLLVARLAFVRSGGNLGLSMLCGLIALGVENYRHSLRPELLSLLLLAGYWILLERLREQPSWMRASLALALVVLWANTHGSFILAPLLAVLYAAGVHLDAMQLQRRLLLAPGRVAFGFALMGVVALAACLVNPSGLDSLAFVFRFGNDADLSMMIAEWQPTFLAKWLRIPGFWLAAAAWVFTASVLVLRRRHGSAMDIVVFVFFSILAVKAIRFPVYMGMVCAYILAGRAPSSWKVEARQAWLHAATAVAACTGLSAALLYGNAMGLRPYTPGPTKFSPLIVQALSDPSRHGNVLNNFSLGAELVYRTWPRLRPSVDARIDSYGTDYVRYQVALLESEVLFDEFVLRYGVRYLLLEPPTFVGFQTGEGWKRGEWRVVARDNSAVFLERVGSTSDGGGRP